VGYDPLAPSGIGPSGVVDPYRDAIVGQGGFVRRVETPQAPVPDMPPVQAARSAWGRRVGQLRSNIAAGEAELSAPDPYAFHGNGNPYLIDIQRSRRVALEATAGEVARLKGELDELEGMSDAEMTDWAVRTDRCRRRHQGGWLVV